MTVLGDLPVPRGATHRKKRIGFGESSGHGKTSTKGHKGQRARSGHGIRPGFEGGQMPLAQRLPKRGFNHVRQVRIHIINLKDLNRFPSGSQITPEMLQEAGLVDSLRGAVKILGEGTLAHPLNIKAHFFSKSAVEKISKAGGTAQKIGCESAC